jgi:glycosyltransferase involved in cell wall biosynthesis
MQLLYTLTAYPPSVGGAQIHTHLLAQQLQQHHPLQVVCHWDSNRSDWLLGTTLKSPSESRNYTIDGISVHRLGLPLREKLQLLPFLPLYYPLMSVALPPIARAIEHHLTPFARQTNLIHNIRIGREGMSYASLQAARKQKVPFVFTPNHHPRWVGWRYQAYIQLYREADQVIALTQMEKKTLLQLGVPEERIAVTGIGPVLAETANPQRFLQRFNLREPIVLFLGQHYSYKGYRQLLEATQRVWEKIPETQFVFVGPAVKQSDRDFVGLDRRIHRLGMVDLQTKTDAIAACTLLCVPSSQESFGGVYTEAWSFGKPVIGCDIPAVAEVVSDGVDGYLVDQEPDVIGDRILDLLLHPTQANTMGLAGKQKVESRFTWQKIAELTESAYHKVI